MKDKEFTRILSLDDSEHCDNDKELQDYLARTVKHTVGEHEDTFRIRKENA